MAETNLNILRDRAFKIAFDHGFHAKELSNEHWLCLVISELMEAVEADRKDEHFVELNDIDNYIRACLTNKEQAFEAYIKDTVEDELADAAIRLLDLAGLKKVDMNDRFIIAYVVNKNKSFTENCYAIIKDIVCYKYSFEERLNYSIRQIFELANFYDINLVWHIEEKMKYNELREPMHGKK